MTSLHYAHLGQNAMKDRDWKSAIIHFTTALNGSNSPLWLTQRSVCYHRTSQFDLALLDAEAAILSAVNRSRRDLVGEAQFRRALALHSFKRYGDARRCLLWAQDKNDKVVGLVAWMTIVRNDWEKAVAEEGGEDGEKTRVVVKEFPEVAKDVGVASSGDEDKPVLCVSAPEDVKQAFEKTKAEKAKGKQASLSTNPTPAPVPIPTSGVAPSSALAPGQTTPKEKIRIDWYQSSQSVSITILAKNVPKDKAQVVIGESSLKVTFPTGSDEYIYDINPLFAQINATASTFRITAHKVEIVLQKSAQGHKWAKVEGDEPVLSSNPSESIGKTEKKEAVPVYPTSSRKGPKNWDAMGSEKEEPDDVDDFFKVIYKNADPDTRRAMMKSFQESNGTALSTSWADVSKGPVETHPPEGVEARKWGE